MAHTRQTRSPTASDTRTASSEGPGAALAARFPEIEWLRRVDGSAKSHVRGGLDVWEYVFIASAYSWDVEEAARHLSEPPERVRAALDYYRAYPEEVDIRLQRMREIEADPEKLLPRAKVVDL